MRRSWSAAVVVMCALAGGVSAADPPKSPGKNTWWGIPTIPNQWRPGVSDSTALAVPQPITRDDEVQEVSLKEAIALALANNPGIAAQRLEPFRVEEGILRSQGQFDPRFQGEVESHQSTTPNASSLSSTAVNNIDERFANFHLLKTFRSGTFVSIDSLNERLDNNQSFISLRPQYTPSLNLSVIQPLLRDFGWDFTYLVVRVSERQADAAVAQYEADLANFVTEVIVAYWNVVRARANVAVQQESKALADRTVVENEARVKVGLFAPVAVLEAQADAKSREEQVIIAENDLAVTRQRLAQLAFYSPDAKFVPRTLEPLPNAELRSQLPLDFSVEVDPALETALAERPEVLASAHTVKARQLNEKIAQNQLLPRVDLVGGYGVNAISGGSRARTVITDIPDSRVPCTAIPGTTNTVLPGAPKFRCVVPASAFTGNRNDAYDRLTDNEFRSYSFGIQFEVPLSNAVARADYAQRSIERNQAELNHRELLSNITFEVRQTAADLLAGRQRIDTTRVARELAEENLRNQEKRHEVGMATTKDLLDFQTRLTSARAAEVQANVDYAIALARWERAQGRLLAQYQIVVEQPGPRSTPWFARF
jgi:outer membrane protein TolC